MRTFKRFEEEKAEALSLGRLNGAKAMKNNGTGRCGVSPQGAPSAAPKAVGAALLAILLASARGMAGDANAPDPLPGADLSSANAPATAWPEGIGPGQMFVHVWGSAVT